MIRHVRPYLVIALLIGAIEGSFEPAGASFTSTLEFPAGMSFIRTPFLADAKRKVQHVVIVVQENRSFDNLFLGFPGANTQNFGFDRLGNKICWRRESDFRSNSFGATSSTSRRPRGRSCPLRSICRREKLSHRASVTARAPDDQ